jgi:para-nitrobenzyl esterase
VGPIVETASGRVEGLVDVELSVFRGVPFARPPTGRLRFARPEPSESWSGVRLATRFGPASPQPAGPLSGLPGFAVDATSEDCLSLNVWTPALDGGARPVMVWIPGGGFTSGSGSQAIYDGSQLARRGDVVVVTINYRLGALGFLSLAGLDADLVSCANAGLADQVAALGWVHDNIAAFGGDPSRVTIFGESAGAMSVACLLGMPAASGLFCRAIAQSGAAANVMSTEEAATLTRRLLSHLDLRPEQTSSLRHVPLERLLAAQQRCTTEYRDARRGLAFRPTIDGDMLPRPPAAAVADGFAADVPLLIGTNADEWRLFGIADPGSFELDDAGLLERLDKTLDVDAATVLDAYRRSRSGASPSDLWFAIETDRNFRIPAMQLAQAQSRHQPNVFAYLFTWRSPIEPLRSCHDIDIPFVFGTLDKPGMPAFAGSSSEAHQLGMQVQDAWLAFAKTGDPSHTSAGEWPPYEPQRRHTKLLDHPCQTVSAPFEHERLVWEPITSKRARHRSTLKTV